MDSNHVTVVYRWTAQPGKLDELASIYADGTNAMEENEPGAEAVHVYVSDDDNALYVRDEFADAGAVGFHLASTAAAHFPALLAIVPLEPPTRRRSAAPGRAVEWVLRHLGAVATRRPKTVLAVSGAIIAVAL